MFTSIRYGLTVSAVLIAASCGQKTAFQGRGTPVAAKKLELKPAPAPQEAAALLKPAIVKTADEPSLPAAVIQNARVSIAGGRLGSQSVIAVDWDVVNPPSLATTTVFWRKPSGTWEEVKDVTATPTGISFTYGARSIGPFEIKVTGTQKNPTIKSTEAIALWQPSVFQTAVLTKTVQCLFCHTRIEGDVGGIEFPDNKIMHEASGTGIKITGRLYSTNAVPDALKDRAVGGFVENYKNTEKHIFPANLKFPELTSEKIEPKVQGSLKGGKLTTGVGNGAVVVAEVIKSFKGNLILDGKDSPLILSGEVFVDGDVVIRGKYKGIGTIYAKNIYIVDNLVAVSSPFPFPANEVDAVAKAKAEIAKGTDALYLAAFQDVVVGDADHGFQGDSSIGGLKTNTPYAWLSQSNYLGLGSSRLIKSDYKMADGSPATWDPEIYHSNHRDGRPSFPIDVSRVDAYIYGGRAYIWESFANSLLNGGYMSQNSVVLSFLQKGTGAWFNGCNPKIDARDTTPNACGQREALVNPVNGLPTHTNVIRFDYRLSAGIPGLESLKEFFTP